MSIVQKVNPQIQPNSMSCLATSAAMVLDVPVKHLFDWLGHDGMQKVWPDKPEPYCYRGFHIQEIIDYVLFGHDHYSPIVIESNPTSHFDPKNTFSYLSTSMQSARLLTYMRKHQGILVGLLGKIDHAYAWDGLHLIDPKDGKKKVFDSDFAIGEFILFRNQIN